MANPIRPRGNTGRHKRDPRLRRGLQAPIVAEQIGDGLEITPEGRLQLKVAGALALAADGTLVLRMGDEFEQTVGSPKSLRIALERPLSKSKVSGKLDLDTVPISKGGTGKRTREEALTALLPEDVADGSILYFDEATRSIRALAKAADGTELRLTSGTPAWQTPTVDSAVVDHGGVAGLGDDDHTQYHNDTRGDARYSQLGHAHVPGDITAAAKGDLMAGTATGAYTALSAGADGTVPVYDSSQARGLNAARALQIAVPISAIPQAQVTWTSMPGSDTFFVGSHRHVQLVPAGVYTEVRLVVNKQATAGSAGAKLTLKYATSFSTSVASYSDIGTSAVEVAINTTNTILDTGWITMASGAKTDIYMALVGNAGAGASPGFGHITAYFRR